ncbi:hypothetical protein AJ80_09451 [Polytolypa hystricis UAMH7299]|uniref:Annexin ANXC4 n=1 Tax=Polytolypa hystricis (strain UAMH7299) TaxID=1447883 RepID=A0A2B7WQ10_POLH7|nr:hypothetical protein AJ80_09451 [Polytolypa hystricis UAMH7299]
MSLRVDDHRSRTRSKSPGGRIRDRSRSRDVRGPSPAPEKSRKSSSRKYYDEDSVDERDRYSTSRPTPATASSTKKYEDYGSEQDRYQRLEKPKHPPGYYYMSDDEAAAKRYPTKPEAGADKLDKYRRESDSEYDKRYPGRSQKAPAPSKYQDDYSDSYTDSDDDDHDALAYGDSDYDYPVPSKGRSDDRSSKALEKYSYSRGSGDEDPAYRRAQSKYARDKSPAPQSREPTRISDEELARYLHEKSKSSSAARDRSPNPSSRDNGRHSSYAQPDAYRYADPKGYYREEPSSRDGRKNRDSKLDRIPSEWGPIPDCERPGFVPPNDFGKEPQPVGVAPPPPASSYAMPDPNLVSKNFPQYAAQGQYAQPQHAQMPPHSAAPYTFPPAVAGQIQGLPGAPYAHPANAPGHQRGHSTGTTAAAPNQYAAPAPFQYAQPDPNIKYISKSSLAYQVLQNQTAPSQTQSTKPYTQTAEPQFTEIRPDRKDRPHTLSVSTGNGNMSLPGSFPDSDRPPASPLLEAYQGTYQCISPMPWPTKNSSSLDEDISDLEPLDGDSLSKSLTKKGSSRSKKSDSRKEKSEKKDKREHRLSTIEPEPSGALVLKKRVSFYDPKPDVKAINSAISHSRVDPKPLLTILPYLTDDDILSLRAEYKNVYKIQGKGINLTKHIKANVPGNFGKVCYATSLGRWESEAHWANFWYRSNSTRRELLIESLIGRTNAEIREIKKCFRDKRYGDDLEKCMKAELKADKFRTAILLALEERRQSDKQPLNMDLIRQDVQVLHRALVSRDGGETAMIQIIVVRSDAHLREILHEYEYTYQRKFANDMINKSRNLVGETLAHILNGALNRPMRDALLLHQAIAESGTGRDRAELLISRLVRMHWEPRHMERVKSEFRRRYRQSIEDAIEEEVMHKGRSDWAEFCVEMVKSSLVHVTNGTA